jgi:uncharacterized protein YlxW (UPF0749 family)
VEHGAASVSSLRRKLMNKRQLYVFTASIFIVYGVLYAAVLTKQNTPDLGGVESEIRSLEEKIETEIASLEEKNREQADRIDELETKVADLAYGKLWRR